MSAWTGSLVTLAMSATLLKPCVTNPPDGLACDPWNPNSSTENGKCKGSAELEPNNNASQANRLADATCQDQFIRGSLSNGTDWYRTEGTRCHKESPSVVAHLTTDSSAIRLCAFVACRNGKAWLTGCPQGNSPDPQCEKAPEGMPGCCRQGAGLLEVDAACDADHPLTFINNVDTALRVYFVAERTDGASECAPYEISYHY